MKFTNRQPASGQENRKLIRVVSGSVTDGEFYADVVAADGAPSDANSVLSAENLNDLTVKAANIEGVIATGNLPSSVTAQVSVSGGNGVAVSRSGNAYTVGGNYASQNTRGMVRMYVSGSTLYIYNS